MILGGFSSALGSLGAQLGAVSLAVVVVVPLPDVLHTSTIGLTPFHTTVSLVPDRTTRSLVPLRSTLAIDGD